MLIRTIAYCGLATSAAWAGVAYPGATHQLTSTERSVPTLDQVSKIVTPGYMSMGRSFQSYVLHINGNSEQDNAGGGSGSFLTSPPQVVEFGSSMYSFDGPESSRQFVNLLAGSTTVGRESQDEFAFSAFSARSASSIGSGFGDDDASGGAASARSTPGTDSSSSSFASSATVSSFAAPQAIEVGDPIPEPSTAVAAGIASCVLLWMRRRTK